MSIPLYWEEADLPCKYVLYRLHIFTIILAFKECGIDVNLPIPKPLEYPWEENQSMELYNTMLQFTFKSFVPFHWLLEQAEMGADGISQIEIDACIAKLPDANHVELQRYHDIFETYGRNFDVIDYFGFLYFPGMGRLDAWLNAGRKEHGLEKSLYDDCIRRMSLLFATPYVEYKGVIVNDTYYTPVIMHFNEYTAEDDVLILQFHFGRIFDAYILSALYEEATKRGIRYDGEGDLDEGRFNS